MDQGRQLRKEKSPLPKVMIEKLAEDDNSSLEDSEPLDENQPRRYYKEENEQSDNQEDDKESENH